jgi:hypothetical protein
LKRTLRAATIIRFGKLIDGTGRVATNAVVRVENDRIQSVTTGEAAAPSGADVIDLSRFTGIAVTKNVRWVKGGRVVVDRTHTASR